MGYPRAILERPLIDRPREKMQAKGPAALSDFELLEVIIGSGTSGQDVSQIARQVQKMLAQDAHNLSLQQLMTIKGISVANGTKLLAALEVSRRYLIKDLTPILTDNDVLARLSDIRNKQQEYLICLSLDGGRRLIAQRTITIGTMDQLLIHPREVFTDPIADRAASIVLAHNHPSGLAQPSAEDQRLTVQLAAAGQLLGIPLYDHLIITKQSYYSFRAHQLGVI